MMAAAEALEAEAAMADAEDTVAEAAAVRASGSCSPTALIPVSATIFSMLEPLAQVEPAPENLVKPG
jgi:hypothetical protein